MLQYIKDIIRAYRHKRILKIFKVPEIGTILDLSCSNGNFLNRLQTSLPKLKLFGIDISDTDIQQAKGNFPNISFSTGSVDRLDFEDDSFDIVFSTMSLHHYAKPIEFLKEAHRVLKSGGVLYITDMIPKYGWTQKVYNWRGCPEPYHFEKFYTAKDVENMLNPLNFRLAKDSGVTLVPRIRLLTIQKY